jgi:hypothetical protein
VILGSIAVHAVIAALLLGIERREPAPPRPPIEIEVMAPGGQPPQQQAARAPQAARASQAAPASQAVLALRPAPAATAAPRPLPAPAVATPGRLAITGYDHGARGSVGTGAGTSLGEGAGEGRGFGPGEGSSTSIGLGGLPSLPPPPRPPPPPPAEKPPSKARPPKLVYPARDRQGDESETFLARLTVDTDGYVVGARLVRGGPGPRAELASQLVWRFRYAPALDDEGRAIRATIDQRFLVGY